MSVLLINAGAVLCAECQLVPVSLHDALHFEVSA